MPGGPSFRGKNSPMRPRCLALLAPFVLAGPFSCGPDPGEAATSAAAPLEAVGPPDDKGLAQGLFKRDLKGVFPNGILADSVLSGALWHSEAWKDDPVALAALRNDPQARELLKYIYHCAMGASQSAQIYDGLELLLTLRGGIGLAPEWGQEGGACGESCQRWVTACLLARANTYGETVQISLRAPDDAPAQVKKALEVSPEENKGYWLREGAFYGNLFHREAQADGATAAAPRLYACAGPGSSIPWATKRFCSSQGSDGPIEVVGACEAPPKFPSGACAGQSDGSSAGAVGHCYSSPDKALGADFAEVITVYLARAEKCGNGLCEEGEAAGGKCPVDCHPGGWARSFAGVLTGSGEGAYQPHGRPWVKTSALGPDGSVVLAGVAPPSMNLGGGELDAGGDGELYGMLAKYDEGGRHLWSVRFGFGPTAQALPAAVAVGPDGRIGVALSEHVDGGFFTRVGLFDASGSLTWTERLVGDVAHGFVGPSEAQALAFDESGDLIVAGRRGEGVPAPGFNAGGAFVAKVSSKGALRWVSDQGPLSAAGARSVTTDHDGNVLLATRGCPAGLLRKLDASTGKALWSRQGNYAAVAAGADGNVYATGTFAGPYGFDLSPEWREGDLFVVAYRGADGAPLRARGFGPKCDDAAPACKGPSLGCVGPDGPPAGGFEGRDIAIGAGGDVIVGAVGGREQATIDFGDGPFRTHATADAFVVALSPELEPRWSKHVPMALDGATHGMQIDPQGRVVMSGTFSGSMQIDGRLLVSAMPDQREVGNTFVAAFALPTKPSE
jgi:hypothetical protein